LDDVLRDHWSLGLQPFSWNQHHQPCLCWGYILSISFHSLHPVAHQVSFSFVAALTPTTATINAGPCNISPKIFWLWPSIKYRFPQILKSVFYGVRINLPNFQLLTYHVCKASM
jgi:hypothetical protein